jgi:alkylation response protein AidB-like acyl-CoA dehydrogenase
MIGMNVSNPGLAPFDLSNYNSVFGSNFFTNDKALLRMIERYSSNYDALHKEEMFAHLSAYGQLVGGVIHQLTEACHKEGKYGELVKYDRNGNRIDEIVYSPEQQESRRLSYKHGVVNLNYHPTWKHPFTHLHRYALTYLMNLNGEGGVACPLAMTDGMIYVLEALGTEEQKKKYLPLVAGAESKSYFMAGQYVTERVGGSNVLANRTVAKKSVNGKWILNGEKWFCSNPGDLWVTSAKLEGTNIVGLFLVPRFKDNGELNGHHIVRKKDIIGSRGKVTTEIIYENLEAEELGRPAHGIANLVKYVISISRLHVAIGACGNSRRAVMEALEYSKTRTAYGKEIRNFPIFARTLCELQILQTSLTFSIFRYIDLLEKKSGATDILAPLLKYKSSSMASYITHQAILCLGGNGIIGDYSPLPRLHNDSIINETWEGTHYIITDHFLHAFQREKKYQNLIELIQTNLTKSVGIKTLGSVTKHCNLLLNEVQDIAKNATKPWKDINRIYIANLVYNCFSLSEMIEQAAHDGGGSIYTDFCLGLSEMISHGMDGKLPTDSIFMKQETVDKILNY